MSTSVGIYGLRLGQYKWLIALLSVLTLFSLYAQTPPAAPLVSVDPTQPNLFYGGVPPNGRTGPVVVFVHALNGNYQEWLESKNCSSPCTGAGNDMYDYAYQAGFRTVFLSLSVDNSHNNASIEANAAMLQTIFPKILSHYSVTKVYFVCHSKGGLDLQAAIANPQWIGIANQVITLGTPNQGDALASWIFLPANQAQGKIWGLLTPAVQSMEVANVQLLRTQWDPIFQNSMIPFFTLAGNTDLCTGSQRTCVSEKTGAVLSGITGGSSAPYNDGLVDQPESLLPMTYSMDLGVINASHYELGLGGNSFNFIYARILAQENQQSGFVRVATNGFGDQHNTYAWSMAWFNNKLYVGTGREVNCVTNATAAIQLGLPTLYPPALGDCTPDYHYLPLQAEIWQYDPSTSIWTRVFQSENSLTTVDNSGKTVSVARDIGFRGLQLVTEPGGVTALYAGGVTSGEIFECHPPNLTTGCSAPGTWPPPRILRTADGVHWKPIPQNGTLTQLASGSSWTPAPGAFLGALTANGCYGTVGPNCSTTTQYQNYSIRSASQLNSAQANSVLFLQVGDFPGVGRVISSAPGANPALGDNGGGYGWASGPTAQLPVWILAEFNNFIYAGTGLPPGEGFSQYGVYKTSGTGAAPYIWTPVITTAAYAQNLIGGYAISMEVFPTPDCPGIGCLYVGTDEASEIARIHPDTTGVVPVDSADSWDLVVGNPRTVPPGQPGAGTLVAPLSGIGQYFDNGFNQIFSRMGVGGQGLYMSTFDWSGALYSYKASLSFMWSQEFGMDVWRTNDGTHWYIVSKIGFGDGLNTEGRTWAATPFGLYEGTARFAGGAQVFLVDNSVVDFNRDGVIDQKDVNLMTVKLNQRAEKNDPMDLDGDGTITPKDVELLRMQCVYPGCTTPPASFSLVVLTAPVLHSMPGALGGPVNISWKAISGAVDYLVYRIALSSSTSTSPPGNPTAIPYLTDGLDPQVGAACNDLNSPSICTILPGANRASSSATALYGYPGPPQLLTRVTGITYSEIPPNALQALYYVVAEDVNGNLSTPSNVVGGPSLASQ